MDTTKQWPLRDDPAPSSCPVEPDPDRAGAEAKPRSPSVEQEPALSESHPNLKNGLPSFWS